MNYSAVTMPVGHQRATESHITASTILRANSGDRLQRGNQKDTILKSYTATKVCCFTRINL